MDRGRLGWTGSFLPYTSTCWNPFLEAKWAWNKWILKQDGVLYFTWIFIFPVKKWEYMDASLKNKSLKVVLGQALKNREQADLFLLCHHCQKWKTVVADFSAACVSFPGLQDYLWRKNPSVLLQWGTTWPCCPHPHAASEQTFALEESWCGPAHCFCMGSLITSNFSSVLR